MMRTSIGCVVRRDHEEKDVSERCGHGGGDAGVRARWLRGGSSTQGQPAQGQAEEPEPQKIRGLDLELKDAFTILRGQDRFCVVTVEVTNNTASTLTVDPTNDPTNYAHNKFTALVSMSITGEDLLVTNFSSFYARPDYEQSASIAPGETGTWQFAGLFYQYPEPGYFGTPGDPLVFTMSTPLIYEGDEMPDITTLTDDIEVETVIDESLDLAQAESHAPDSPYVAYVDIIDTTSSNSYVVADDGSLQLWLVINFTNNSEERVSPADVLRVTCEQDGVELTRIEGEDYRTNKSDGTFEDTVRPGDDLRCWVGYSVTSSSGYITSCVYVVNDDTWPLASLNKELDPDEW